MARVVTPTQLDFSYGTRVISAAQKFVIPVPEMQGEPLVYPEGTEKAGQSIVDWQGNPIGDKGVVFFNGKDSSYQAARTGVQDVVIVNNVDLAHAGDYYARYREITAANGWTVESFKGFLSFIRESGNVDMYNSDDGFIGKNMTPVLENGECQIVDQRYQCPLGFLKRDARDIGLALYSNTPFEFQGPSATPQIMELGGVILSQGGSVRAIQPDVFMTTYMLADGGRQIIDLEKQITPMQESQEDLRHEYYKFDRENYGLENGAKFKYKENEIKVPFSLKKGAIIYYYGKYERLSRDAVVKILRNVDYHAIYVTLADGRDISTSPAHLPNGIVDEDAAISLLARTVYDFRRGQS